MQYETDPEVLKACRKRYKQLTIGVFSRKNSAFLAPLLCGLKVNYIKSFEERGDFDWIMFVDGEGIYMNTKTLCLVDLKDGMFCLEHELWHIGRLHHYRAGDKCHEIWNQACDHVINLAMIQEGKTTTLPILANKDFIGMSEEQVYAALANDQPNKSGNQDSNSNTPGDTPDNANSSPNDNHIPNNNDMLPATNKTISASVNNVIKSQQQAQMSGGLQPGALTADLERLWGKLLAPKIPWETILRRLMKDLVPKDRVSWKRRNRRFPDIHLPSMVANPKRLSHLVYAIDVSGSVDEDQFNRIVTEITYIHEHLKPERITILQFDEEIKCVDEFTDKQRKIDIKLVGGGGTSYRPIKRYVDSLDKRPEGLIIFTDLYCDPMPPLNDSSIPVFWVAVNTDLDTVPFGKVIKVDD